VKAGPPAILVVDDELDDAQNFKRDVGDAAHVEIRTPDEVRKSDLERADLVLVDYELDAWLGSKERLMSPANGLALSAVIREQISALSRGTVTAVALWSGQVEKIASTLPAGLQSFAFARLNNLEWVFKKGTDEAAPGAVSLAWAVRELPRTWPIGDPEMATKELHKLLGLSTDMPFFVSAADEVSAGHPPIHELSAATHGLVVIRWIAHRILPYPAFLLARLDLASRLRIDPLGLDRLLVEKSEFSRQLEGVEYKGALRGLYDRNWWRSGLEGLIFDWTGGSGGLDVLHQSIRERAKHEVVFLDHEVVPGIDESYRAAELIPVEDALRLRLDDWPPFADAAWAERSLAADSDQLRGLVLPLDRELLA